MWARVVEVMLGFWMVVSPFIFRHAEDATGWWVNDITCGTLVTVLGLFSFWQFSLWWYVRNAHLLIVLVGLWMIVFAFINATDPPAPAAQNNVTVALLLIMLAIVPNEAELPPVKWRSYLAAEIEESRYGQTANEN